MAWASSPCGIASELRLVRARHGGSGGRSPLPLFASFALWREISHAKTQRPQREGMPARAVECGLCGKSGFGAARPLRQTIPTPLPVREGLGEGVERRSPPPAIFATVTPPYRREPVPAPLPVREGQGEGVERRSPPPAIPTADDLLRGSLPVRRFSTTAKCELLPSRSKTMPDVLVHERAGEEPLASGLMPQKFCDRSAFPGRR